MLDNEHIELLYNHYLNSYSGSTPKFFKKLFKSMNVDTENEIYPENPDDIRWRNNKYYNQIMTVVIRDETTSMPFDMSFDTLCRKLKLTNEDIIKFILHEI